MRKITIKNLQRKIPVYPKRIKTAVLKVFTAEGKKLSLDITVSFVNDKLIRELNRKFLKVNHPTDVLAFDLSRAQGKKHLVADLVISTDTAEHNGKIYKTSTQYELELYAIHAALHLLGYDDRTLKGANLMRKKECQFIKQTP
ncbi:MAG: rRNA maturation RNase YbeY [Candidatus Omnitrophota bacterium]